MFFWKEYWPIMEELSLDVSCFTIQDPSWTWKHFFAIENEKQILSEKTLLDLEYVEENEKL